ncbi:MAG: hypothetical protein DM484_03440 [Candidatus Methylumidiphilus alinenensis]|uniref:Lipoprotein SmpA/OmlA domain-containing protein n=1 Tax=Candidatus Methylumidiphilus alinenensis TaxID=2202197 RepID=A0A2W4RX67_9GAMM|nr:MAG: hypothetical protein DM484_03440 [Candidatus Methylumidiphilus alinenensis]
MHRKKSLFFALILLSLLGACNKQIKPSELVPGIELGQFYYTQFSLFQEQNNFRTTNYRRGFLIPVNTRVSLVSISSKKAELKLADSGQPLTIENVPKHTNEDMQTAFKKIVGPRKVDIDTFSKAEQESILTGKVKKGMGRKAVLVAIGYPPQIETPSLDSNDWTYWSSRFNKFIVHFKNGKVDNIVD